MIMYIARESIHTVNKLWLSSLFESAFEITLFISTVAHVYICLIYIMDGCMYYGLRVLRKTHKTHKYTIKW